MDINNATYRALSTEGIAAQGDLLIVRSALYWAEGNVFNNDDWEIVVSPPAGEHVVAHSETGHHHVLRAYRPPAAAGILAGMALKAPELLRQPTDGGGIRSICRVPEDSLAEIVHLRNTHTHGTHILPPGEWVLLRQQRPTPEGWTVVTD